MKNLSDGSSGTISAVHKAVITVRRLTGGIENDFDFGELYRLRANTGVAAPGSLGLTLVDPRVDFIARGIVNGDVVENLSDRSVGRVAGVGGPTMLTVSGLYFGRNNQFRENDVYRLPRFNAGNHTRKGLLSVHEPGKRFPTGFQVEWRVPVLDRYVITGFTPDTQSGMPRRLLNRCNLRRLQAASTPIAKTGIVSGSMRRWSSVRAPALRHPSWTGLQAPGRPPLSWWTVRRISSRPG